AVRSRARTNHQRSRQLRLLIARRSRIGHNNWHTLRTKSMPKPLRIVMWIGIALLGALAVATIALRRGEQINAMWLVVAAFCSFALGYRFYSNFISAKVLALDEQSATPAERLENGRDCVPSNKWAVL